MLIGRLGSTTLAAHQIALNFSGMMFMVPMSLGLALTVKIGHALGALSAVGFALCSASIIVLFAPAIVAVYTADLTVRAIAAKILLYSASFQLFDGLQVTAVGSLRGYHDTGMTMLITIVAYWGVGLPLGYALGFTEIFGNANVVFGLWTGLIAGLAVAALLLNWRLVRVSGSGQTT